VNKILIYKQNYNYLFLFIVLTSFTNPCQISKVSVPTSLGRAKQKGRGLGEKEFLPAQPNAGDTKELLFTFS